MSIPAFLTIIGTVLLCSLGGKTVVNLAGLTISPAVRFPAELLVGYSILSSLMLLLCLLFKISAGTAFLLTCIPCFSLFWFGIGRRIRSQKTAATPWLTALVCIPSLIWSWQAVRSVPRLRTGTVFKAWVDFFYHTDMIIQFAKGGTDVFQAGAHIPLYHYASYVFSAVICNFSQVPAIVISTAHWCLFGFILMGIGAWSLGAVLAGELGAWLALVFLFLLPNAAHYGMRNAFLDFDWLLQISAGLSHGLGLCLLVLTICVVAVRMKSIPALYMAVILTLLEALFKMQLFALLLPVCCFTLLLLWHVKPVVKLSVGAGLCVAALVGSLIAEKIERAPHFWSAAHPVTQTLGLILDVQQSAINHPFSRAAANFPSVFTIPVGLVLLLIAAFGVLLPAYLLALYYLRKQGVAQADHFIPLIVVVCYCLIVVSFPISTYNGSIEEYQHRSFVFVYAVLAVWSGVFLVEIVSRWLTRRSMYVFALILTVVLIPFPLWFSAGAQIGRMDWSRSYARTRLPEGFQKTGEYVRQKGRPGESIFVDDSTNEDAMIAFSEHRAVLAFVRGVHYSPVVLARRQAISKQLQQAKTYAELTQAAHEQGITWYVAAPDTVLADTVAKQAMINIDGFRTFHFSPYR